ncbi:family 43 glycosylhydrolase [Flammeovirga yaeyamensis]|uniref:Family 43 glycosylhydrolase n=1 Tax=Flammeovirga yaeyamensis TaxID=367791 RepID=A0AAX1N5Y3_9BACT|nr:glycoside hydrolase family 43 protein [Flammeovirga yaeyamensis]MBB3697573.1 beta-xylosidase [Flammeovirga yaeyamensis]NMF36265.1 family 43 glycosylhydrolase [Flammeovirga yaeyamensis]QWG02994.1 family 43 glycosylhydrolase [Flammeovirga yaeyamensis]
MNRYFLLLFLGILCSCTTKNSRYTNFQPGQIWEDNNGQHINAHGGGILYHNDTYYWYGEHKIEGHKGNTAQVGVHVYSSKDLYNWVDEGIALEVDTLNVASDIARGCIIERPKVIYNQMTNKYIMWFHLELISHGYDAARSGVAISDSPIGPFTYLKSMRPNKGHWPLNVQEFHKKAVADTVKSAYCGGKECLPNHPDSLNLLGRDFEGGQMARDMNLFVDDDGKAYHLYSSEENSTLHIAELSEDYLSHTGNYVRVFPNRYMEAPSIMKTSGGKYYFIGSDCTSWNPNPARSASADHIFGPWTELGNPVIGTEDQKATTFKSQSTYILPVQGKKDAFIFMADRWQPNNAIDGRYIWLPIQFDNDRIILEWKDQWDLTVYN